MVVLVVVAAIAAAVACGLEALSRTVELAATFRPPMTAEEVEAASSIPRAIYEARRDESISAEKLNARSDLCV